METCRDFKSLVKIIRKTCKCPEKWHVPSNSNTWSQNALPIPAKLDFILLKFWKTTHSHMAEDLNLWKDNHWLSVWMSYPSMCRWAELWAIILEATNKKMKNCLPCQILLNGALRSEIAGISARQGGLMTSRALPIPLPREFLGPNKIYVPGVIIWTDTDWFQKRSRSLLYAPKEVESRTCTRPVNLLSGLVPNNSWSVSLQNWIVLKALITSFSFSSKFKTHLINGDIAQIGCFRIVHKTLGQSISRSHSYRCLLNWMLHWKRKFNLCPWFLHGNFSSSQIWTKVCFWKFTWLFSLWYKSHPIQEDILKQGRMHVISVFLQELWLQPKTKCLEGMGIPGRARFPSIQMHSTK